MQKVLPVVLLVCLCIGTAHSRGLNQLVAPAAAASAAAAAPAATQPTAAAAPAKPVASWVQRDGYVPLPKVLEDQPEAKKPAAPEKPALPPANNFGAFTLEPPPADPTGTNVFADPKYAPAAVRAAYQAQNPTPESNLPAAGGAMPSAPGAMGAGMAPMAPAGGISSMGVFSGPAGVGAAPAAAGGGGGGGNDGVFANTGAGFSNRYTPSVGNAIGSSDILVKMLIDAPEQQVAASGDALRAAFANVTQTPADRIYIYQTRTINSAAGQPSLDLTLLFKNNVDVDRARQQNVLLSTDIMRGLVAQVAQSMALKIQQGSIKVSPAVNDGGAMSTAATPMMPGQMPGLMPGMGMNGSLMPGFGVNPGAPAGPAAPAPSNTAGEVTAQLALPLLLLAALAAL